MKKSLMGAWLQNLGVVHTFAWLLLMMVSTFTPQRSFSYGELFLAFVGSCVIAFVMWLCEMRGIRHQNAWVDFSSKKEIRRYIDEMEALAPIIRQQEEEIARLSGDWVHAPLQTSDRMALKECKEELLRSYQKNLDKYDDNWRSLMHQSDNKFRMEIPPRLANKFPQR